MPIVITQETNQVWNGPALARLNQQTGVLLKQTEENPGVSGAFVCDNQGALLAARFSEALQRSVLEQTGRWLAQILAACELRGGKPRQVELYYDNAGFLVWDLGNAFEVVECVPNVNWALLRMALNVSAPSFEQDAELQKSLARIAPSRVETLEQGQDPDSQHWIRRMQMGAAETPTADPATMAQALELMVRLTNLLIDEFGDRGFGRDNVLRIVEHRLTAMTAKQPVLGSVRVANRRVEITVVEMSPADFEKLAVGWGELVKEIRQAAADNLGAKMADSKYAKTVQSVSERDAELFKSANLERVLPKV